MALPIAQLGYSPSMNLTVGSQKTRTTSPWVQMAAQVLGNIGTQGAENLMQRDYSTAPGETPDQGGNIVQGTNANAATTTGLGSNGSTTAASVPGQTGAGAAPSQGSFWDTLIHGPKTTSAMHEQTLNRASQANLAQTAQAGESERFKAGQLNETARHEQTMGLGQQQLAVEQANQKVMQQIAAANSTIGGFNAQTARMHEQSITDNLQFQKQYAGSQILHTVETMAQNIQKSSMMAHSGVGLPQSATPEQVAAWQAAHPIIPYDEAFKMARERAASVNPYGMPGSVGIPPPSEAGTYNFDDLTQPNDTAQ